MRKPGLFSIALSLLTCTAAIASDPTQCLHDPAENRMKIGLALGGGGARGEAHIGVLQVLEELRIPVDYVAGTSMGSIVGGLYATGMTSPELEQVIRDIDWDQLFQDDTRRQDLPFRRKRDDELALFGPKLGLGKDSSLLPKGAIGGQKVGFLFETLVNQRVNPQHFDQLPIPFRAIAADIVTGDEVRLSDGAVSVAMKASMSVPGVFAPLERDGRLLVDGGIVNNLPINVVREMGADLVIAVEVGSGLTEKKELDNLLAITNQMINLLIENNTNAQIDSLGKQDILIVPRLGDRVGAADFDKLDIAMPLGNVAAQGQREKLTRFSLSPEEYAHHRRYVADCVTGAPIIDWVRIDNRTKLRDAIFQEQLHVQVGEPLNIERLDHDIKQIYGMGFMHSVPYRVIEENGKTGLLVTVHPDERGNNLIEYGLDLIGNSDSAGINLRVGFLKTDMDDLGSEFRALVQVGEDYGLLVELYKPMDERLRFILLPRFSAERFELGQYDGNGNQLSTVQVEQIDLSFQVGREFGRHASAFVGARIFDGDARTVIGSPIESFDFDGGEYFLSVAYDRLDNRYFPSTGLLSSLSYLTSSDSLGADDDYEQIAFNIVKPWTWGRHTLIGGLNVNTTLDDNAPIYARFRGGGFLRLSGLYDNELNGQHFGVVSASYRYEVGRTGFLPAYAGTTLEFGNAAETAGDVFGEGIVAGSLYFGYDSPIGPMYIGYGLAEGGRSNYFLRVGNVLSSPRFGR